MKIMKFGGSSVANAQNVKKVIDIVLDSFAKNGGRVVVVSALGGITDELLKLATLASQKNTEYKKLFKNICERHDQLVRELIDLEKRERVLSEINKKYDELEKILRSGELSKQFTDAVASFGEQLSSFIISEAIKSRGVACQYVDARTVIKTDDNFGEGNVDIKDSYKKISELIKDEKTIYVMGGFIGSTKDGVTTTLGRGGSDYTASLVGAALDAEAVEVWKDVDGLMTADPKKVKDACLIKEISYCEAEKMACLGAKVIFHKTMKPVQLKGIPIFIKNTFNPNGNGTKIQ